MVVWLNVRVKPKTRFKVGSDWKCRSLFCLSILCSSIFRWVVLYLVHKRLLFDLTFACEHFGFDGPGVDRYGEKLKGVLSLFSRI